jgi:hypothetical protein
MQYTKCGQLHNAVHKITKAICYRLLSLVKCEDKEMETDERLK